MGGGWVGGKMGYAVCRGCLPGGWLGWGYPEQPEQVSSKIVEALLIYDIRRSPPPLTPQGCRGNSSK